MSNGKAFQRKDSGQIKEYSLADAAVRTVFLSIVTLLCMHAAVRMAQDIFPGWELSKKAVLWMHGAVFFTAALVEMVFRAMPGWVRLICKLALPVVYSLMLFQYGKRCQIDLEDGACALATDYFKKLNAHTHTAIFIWKGKTEFISLAFAFWIFAILLGLLLASMFFARHSILLFLPAAVLVLELLIGYIPQWKGLAMFFTALLFVRADNESGGCAAVRAHYEKKKRYTQVWYLSWVPIVCLAGVGACILFISGMLTDATADRWMAQAPNVQAFQKNAENRMLNIGRSYFKPSQETVHNGTPHYTEKEMLKVTASKLPSEDLLLKGFCGTDYKNGNWICDRQKFGSICAELGYDPKEEAKQLLEGPYHLFSQGAERMMMRYTFGGDFMTLNVSENNKVDYTIEHTGINSSYAFLPYAVAYEKENDKKKYVADAMVQKNWRQHTFSYSGWDHFAGGIDISTIPQEKIHPVFQWYDIFAKRTYMQIPDGIPSVNEYMEAMQKLQQEQYKEASSLFINVEEETAKSFFDTQIWNLPENQNWLRLLYLQQEATYVDGPSWTNLNRLQSALVIAATLKRFQSYSLELDPLPEGTDPVTYFLMDCQKGYCMHFASAAVLLLREMGVPARYASGYVVRVKQFQKKGGQYVASVKDSNAHAWAEIYLEQIGWVPIDVTPAWTNMEAGEKTDHADTKAPVNDTDTDETQTNIDETDTDETDAGETDADDTKTDETDTHRQEEKPKSFWMRYRLVFAAAAVLLLCMFLYGIGRCICWLYRSIPMREIKAGKYSKAVCRMNWRIYCKMCVRSKIARRNLSDTQYEQMLKAVYQQIEIEKWSRFMQIVLAAAYAKEEVSQKEAQFCWNIYEKI